MAIPTYDALVQPLLSFLHERKDGVRTAEAYDELAKRVELTPEERAKLLPSGLQPMYQNRIGWAHDRLKRAGLSSSPQRGFWKITEAGTAFVAKNGQTYSVETINAALSLADGDVPDPTLRIGTLASAMRTPAAVTRDAPLLEAMTLMLLRNYSQLPVMQGERVVNGVISWKSIGRRQVAGGTSECVRDCMDEHVVVVNDERPLFDVLDAIIENDFVLVSDSTKRIAGIVTMSDVGEQFRDMSEPFLLLQAVENHIRKLIAGKFPVESLRAVRDGDDRKNIGGIFDLTFREYMTLLEKDENWKKLKLVVDRRIFLSALDRVREIRNSVMHFDPDAEDNAVHELRDFVRFLREIAPVS